MHKHHRGHHEGVKHHGAHHKDAQPSAARPSSGNHKPERTPGDASKNECSHMSWGDGSHHSGHAYKR